MTTYEMAYHPSSGESYSLECSDETGAITGVFGPIADDDLPGLVMAHLDYDRDDDLEWARCVAWEFYYREDYDTEGVPLQ